MARITIDGVEIECREGISVLQAALEAGLDVPHYCYHPGLSVVASCRICLMEMKSRHPQTGEMAWSPKLVPSCQTNVSDGMEVRYKSPKVVEAREKLMEFLLVDHPLDCPVCDQAGECLLQDYAERFGHATSRMVEQKHVNPKKDIGPGTMLYQNRCILCTRCVRFAREIAGTNELCVVNRGSRNEIDVFPGKPLDNPLQGNVVDVCPVGSMLDKDFLFSQRVWFLESGDSICPGCSTGCAIRIDHNHGKVYRFKPRYNPGVNDWWICDYGRFLYKHINDERRLTKIKMRAADTQETLDWDKVIDVIIRRLGEMANTADGRSIAIVLSPFLACEEAWLLGKAVRKLAPQAVLVPGYLPDGEPDRVFPVGASGDDVKFTIRGEKCPNSRGVEVIIAKLGGPAVTFAEFLTGAASGEYIGVWITGGYLDNWVTKELLSACMKAESLLVQDMLPTELSDKASLVLPMCSIAEREGSFVNATGKLQPFAKAMPAGEGRRSDGQFLLDFANRVGAVDCPGVFNGDRVRTLMATDTGAFDEIWVAPAPPAHQH